MEFQQNKQSNKATASRLSRILAVFLALTLIMMTGVSAVTQAEIDALKKKQSNLSGSKSSLQAKITATQNDKEQAMAQKRLLEQQIEVLRQELDVTNTLIAQYEAQIVQKTTELEMALEKEEEYDQLFRERVRAMEESGSTISYWAILFDASDFSDMLDKIDNINAITVYDNFVMEELAEARATVATAKQTLETAKTEQEAAKVQLEASSAQLKAQEAEFEALAKELDAKQAEYQTQMHEMEREEVDINGKLAAAEKQYAKQIADAKKQQQQQQQNNNNSGGGSDSSGGGGGGGYKWPVPGYGKGSFTSKYGWRMCPFHGREYHSGIDIGAPGGTPIVATKSGTVVISTYHSSYGNYVVIAHNDGGKSLYAHMQSRGTAAGTSVSAGTQIGRVGTTGSSTGNHLHFEIWTGSTSSTRVNPANYF